jgi:hypothetical protein
MVNYPAFGIVGGMLLVTSYLLMQKLIPVWGYFLGFVIAFGLSWLWWSFMITKWRLWAFENVRNVHELKKRAIREKLIWKDGSIFEKTEIRNAESRAKWALLEEKFKREDVFQDDLTIPNETIIYYSKSRNLFAMALMLLCTGVGIYLIVGPGQYILGAILTIIGAFSSFRSFKIASNTTAQIIINNKGIETVSTGFFRWDEVMNEEVSSEGSGSDSRFYLKYDHPAGSERLLIDDFDTDQRRLNNLLILYRGRSERNKTKS